MFSSNLPVEATNEALREYSLLALQNNLPVELYLTGVSDTDT